MCKRLLTATLLAALVVCPASATLTTSSNTVTYTGNGSTTAFSTTFPFQQASDLVVTVAGATKTNGADYSLTGAGFAAGGTVTFSVAPPNGVAVVITRTVDYLQRTSLRGQGQYLPSAIEKALDKVSMGQQQLQALYTNPPASVLPANVVAKLNNLRMADQFANIQAAITDAGTTGAVMIPSSYSASDTWTNPNGIPIIDLRGGAGRWRGVVSVRDWGAVGDGSADDTGPIQSAITAANGGTVEFPSPATSYKVTNTLTVSVAGTKLRGNNSKIYMAFGSAATPTTLFSVTASNVEFDGLWIDSTGTSSTTLGNKYAIRYQGSSGTHLTNARVRNCQFTNLPWNFFDLSAPLAAHALYIQWTDTVAVLNDRFDTVGGAAVFLSGVTNAKILDNFVNDTGWYSIQFNDKVDGARISGNSITGNTSGDRIWGGSINLMSNSSTGTNCGTPGCAQIRNVEVDHNYIAGVHSYTGAVHIESASHISFHNNFLEKITLTQGSPFYADGSPAVYVRPYVRPSAGSTNEGPNDHIDISYNTLIAGSVGAIAIYADAQNNGGALAYSDTLTVRGNRVHSLDSTHYFSNGISVHGQQGGWQNVAIVGNEVSGFPDGTSPSLGLIGTQGLVGAPVLDTLIAGNQVTVIGGTSVSTLQLGIGVHDYTTRTRVADNFIGAFWQGVRTFTNASAVTAGSNTFGSTLNADYIFGAGAAPAAAAGTSPYFGSTYLTGQTANIGATNVVASADAGEYRLCGNARTTTNGTGTTANLNLSWTDETGVKTDAVGTWALNAINITGQINKCDFIHVAAATNIQFSVTAGTYGTSAYALSVTVEKLK